VQDLAYALQLLLGIVFLSSVVPKLRRPGQFRAVVAGYDVLPRWAPVFAPTVIIVEGLLAVAFLTGWLVAVALVVAALLITVFALATGVNLRRGRRIDCGCFGATDEQISGRSLGRLGAMVLAVGVLAVGMSTDVVSAITIGSLAAEGASSLAYVVATLGLSVFFMVISLWALRARELAVALRRERGVA